MNTIIILIVIFLLFGGGYGYTGGRSPYIGHSSIGLLIVVLIVIYLLH